MIYQVGKDREDLRFNFYGIADSIYDDLLKASGKLQMKVEEPYWIELESESD